jgi:hypothetical protein
MAKYGAMKTVSASGGISQHERMFAGAHFSVKTNQLLFNGARFGWDYGRSGRSKAGFLRLAGLRG